MLNNVFKIQYHHSPIWWNFTLEIEQKKLILLILIGSNIQVMYNFLLLY